jgi:hypothetical protein
MLSSSKPSRSSWFPPGSIPKEWDTNNAFKKKNNTHDILIAGKTVLDQASFRSRTCTPHDNHQTLSDVVAGYHREPQKVLVPLPAQLPLCVPPRIADAKGGVQQSRSLFLPRCAIFKQVNQHVEAVGHIELKCISYMCKKSSTKTHILCVRVRITGRIKSDIFRD